MAGSIQSPTSYGHNFGSYPSTSRQSTTENTASTLLGQTVCVPEKKTEPYLSKDLQKIEIDQLCFSDRHIKERDIDSLSNPQNTAEKLKRSFDDSSEQPSTSKKIKISSLTLLLNIKVTQISETKQQEIKDEIQKDALSSTTPWKQALPNIIQHIDGPLSYSTYTEFRKIYIENFLKIINMLFKTKTGITVRQVLYYKINCARTSNNTTLSSIDIDDIFGYTPKIEELCYHTTSHNSIKTEELPNHLNLLMTIIYCGQQDIINTRVLALLCSKFKINISIASLIQRLKVVLNLDILDLFLIHNYFTIGGTVSVLNNIGMVKRIPSNIIQQITWILAGTEEFFPDDYSKFFKELQEQCLHLMEESLPQIPGSKLTEILIDTANKERVSIKELHDLHALPGNAGKKTTL